jgi:hypothetical protein
LKSSFGNLIDVGLRSAQGKTATITAIPASAKRWRGAKVSSTNQMVRRRLPGYKISTRASKPFAAVATKPQAGNFVHRLFNDKTVESY